jgi:hypothetical protein
VAVVRDPQLRPPDQAVLRPTWLPSTTTSNWSGRTGPCLTPPCRRLVHHASHHASFHPVDRVGRRC